MAQWLTQVKCPSPAQDSISSSLNQRALWAKLRLQYYHSKQLPSEKCAPAFNDENFESGPFSSIPALKATTYIDLYPSPTGLSSTHIMTTSSQLA